MLRFTLLIALFSVMFWLPTPASAMCADAASCRIFSAGMLSILCTPIYLIGLIVLVLSKKHSILMLFGGLGVLATFQAAFAIIPTRADLWWYLPLHAVPAIMFLFFSIRSIYNNSNPRLDRGMQNSLEQEI